MPGYQEQQVLQQLLSGMNTMQMQAGLMPGGIPTLNQSNMYAPPPPMTPAQFSNNLSLQFRSTFQPYPVTPPMFGSVTPVPRPFSANYLPAPSMGSGWGMARQMAHNQGSGSLVAAQGLAGFGGDVAAGMAGAAAGAAIGTAIMPGLGTAAGFAGGLAGSYFMGGPLGSLAQMPFKPFLDQRARGIQLQNMSMYNVRTGSDLSSSGIGLSNVAAQDLERNLMRMSDNRDFKRDTGQMFNRQDMMKMTAISSQVGLLDNAQSVSQISRDMGKIGRALATFMKVVEEPDVIKALQMMGNMRNMGMNIPEMNVAAQNARVFARMAGTSVQGVMQAGMQGADTFRQFGMSGAAGFGVGTAAAGSAGNVATWMKPRELEMLGGRGGVQNAFIGAAAQMSNLDVFLPGLAKMEHGHLNIDPDAIKKLMSGKNGITDMVRESSRRLSGMGPRGFVEAYSTQRGELRDKFMSEMGGEASTLLPMMYARMMVQTGAVESMGAGLRLLGIEEREARTLELAYQSEDYWKNKREAYKPNEFEAQGKRVRQREDTQKRASSAAWRRVGKSVASAVTFGNEQALLDAGTYANNRLGEIFVGDAAIEADVAEQQTVAGGGEVMQIIKPDRFMSSVQLKQARDLAKQPQSADMAKSSREVRMGMLSRARASVAKENADFAANDLMFRPFKGPDGFSLNTQGEYLGDVVRRNQGWVKRNQLRITGMLDTVLGRSPLQPLQPFDRENSPEAIDRLARDQEALGKQVSAGKDDTTSENRRRLLEQTTAQGIGARRTTTLVSIGAEAVKKYIADTYSPIPGVGGMGETRSQDIQTAIKADLFKSGLSADASIMTPEYMQEVYRATRARGDDTTRAGLDIMETRGADAGAALRGKVVAHTVEELENYGATVLEGLGLFKGKYDAAEGQQILDLFGETGDDAEIKKKLYAIAALRKQAEAGNSKAGDKADMLEAELKDRPDISDDKLTELRTKMEAFTDNIAPKTLAASGKQFTKKFDVNRTITTENILNASSKGARNRLQMMPGVAMTQGFSAAFAEKYNEKEGADKATYLAEYMRLNPDKFADYDKEAIAKDPMAFEQMVMDKFKGGTEAIVAGGQATGGATSPSGLTGNAKAVVDVLEAWSKADRDRAEAAYSKIEHAAAMLEDTTLVGQLSDVVAAGQAAYHSFSPSDAGKKK